MKAIVGSMDEIEYISCIIQKQITRKKNIENKKTDSKINEEEYRFLQHLIFKYCFIPNIDLNT